MHLAPQWRDVRDRAEPAIAAGGPSLVGDSPLAPFLLRCAAVPNGLDHGEPRAPFLPPR